MQPKQCSPEDGMRGVAKGTFADDALNWAFGKDYAACVNRLRLRLRATELWCNKWRLKLNPAKCEAMVFGHYGSSPPTVCLQLYGQPIPQVTRVRYLGLYLTPHLSWSHHLDVIASKVKPRLGSLFGLAKRHVLPKKLCLLFYKSLLESLFTYGAPALFCMPSSTKRQLLELQAHCLRALLDLPFETDLIDVLAYAGVDSVEDIYERALMRFGYRCLAANLETADYIKYVAKIRPATDEARNVLESKCPAWHLRNCQRSGTLTLDSRNWLEIF